MRMRDLAGLALALATLGASAKQASALDFYFSFDNNVGNVSGTVTGEVFGLVDNATSSATKVEILSWPSGLIPAGNESYYPSPIDATAWATQGFNQFTVVDGVVTLGQFQADGSTAVSSLDRLYLNYSDCSSGPNCSYLSIGSNDTLNVWHDTYGTTFTAASTVPEPATWALMIVGFAGLGLAGYRTTRKSAAA